MSAKTRVAIAGASGMTGTSIVNALLSKSEKFEVIALARPSSIGKAEYLDFAERGVLIKPVDLSEPSGALVQALLGMDVVISCLTLLQMKEEMALITAAHQADVGRFVPSFFAPCCPPRGVMLARNMKEDISDHIKRLYLPYTIIDVGWWYQLSLPPLPSGGIPIKMEYSIKQIIGDGNTQWALTDNRDIGKFVERIIVDPKTLNKAVFGYGEVWTQNDVWAALEKISSESIPREYTSKEELLEIISEGEAQVAKNNYDPAVMLRLGMAQYSNLLGIRGDNTPEHANYLGYLDARQLYPDLEITPLQDYIKDLVGGKLHAAYSSKS